MSYLLLLPCTFQFFTTIPKIYHLQFLKSVLFILSNIDFSVRKWRPWRMNFIKFLTLYFYYSPVLSTFSLPACFLKSQTSFTLVLISHLFSKLIYCLYLVKMFSLSHQWPNCQIPGVFAIVTCLNPFYNCRPPFSWVPSC